MYATPLPFAVWFQKQKTVTCLPQRREETAALKNQIMAVQNELFAIEWYQSQQLDPSGRPPKKRKLSVEDEMSKNGFNLGSNVEALRLLADLASLN